MLRKITEKRPNYSGDAIHSYANLSILHQQRIQNCCFMGKWVN